MKEVDKGLSSIRFDDELKSALADKLKHQYEIQNGNTYYHLNKSRDELEDITIKQKKMMDLLIDGTISKEDYRQRNIEFESLKSDLKFKISKMENPDTSVEQAIDNILNFSQNSFELFKSSKIEEKRRILNIVFSNFLLDGKNVEISMPKTSSSYQK